MNSPIIRTTKKKKKKKKKEEEEDDDWISPTQLRRRYPATASPPVAGDTQNREPGNLSSAVCRLQCIFTRAIFQKSRFLNSPPNHPHPSATMLAHAHSAESFIKMP